MSYEKILDKNGIEIFEGDSIVVSEDIVYEDAVIKKNERFTVDGFPTNKNGIQIRHNNKDVVLPAHKVIALDVDARSFSTRFPCCKKDFNLIISKKESLALPLCEIKRQFKCTECGKKYEYVVRSNNGKFQVIASGI